MKIVVLDGYTLNPGDLSWDGLKNLATDFTVYERTAPSEVVARSAGADVLFTNKTVLTAEHFDALPTVKYVGIFATGYNVVDTAAAAKKGVTVTNVPAYSTYSVAQHAFALLLELCLHPQEHSEAVRAGEWAKSIDFSFRKYPLIELQGKTLGIIGFGEIGRKMAEIAYTFGLNVLAYKPNPDANYKHPDFAWVTFDEILEQSDILTLHCPLTPDSQGMINKSALAKMKSSAFLINTARGGLLVEQDVADALNNDKLAGAGLDVLSTEPPAHDNPLLTAKNCIITPHIAWASKEARLRLMVAVIQNLNQFLNGTPINVVSKI
ncbi:MAG: D-2-hydroxyacid dehydrogenase [Defluviitaleaceae bacterium]|nr:D-2-hydroxyacid dehydrogenase [Defluviitaleaceae bacterium]